VSDQSVRPTVTTEDRERACQEECVEHGIPLCPTFGKRESCQHRDQIARAKARERERFAEEAAKAIDERGCLYLAGGRGTDRLHGTLKEAALIVRSLAGAYCEHQWREHQHGVWVTSKCAKCGIESAEPDKVPSTSVGAGGS